MAESVILWTNFLPEIVVYAPDGNEVDGLDYSEMTPLMQEAPDAHLKKYEKKVQQPDTVMKQQTEILLRLKRL